MVTPGECFYYLIFVFDLINPTSFNYTVKPPTRLNISVSGNRRSRGKHGLRQRRFKSIHSSIALIQDLVADASDISSDCRSMAVQLMNFAFSPRAKPLNLHNGALTCHVRD